MPPKNMLGLSGVPDSQQVAPPAPAPAMPETPSLLGLGQQGAALAQQQLAAAQGMVTPADDPALAFIAALGGIGGALTGRPGAADPALELIRQRNTQQREGVQHALGAIQRGTDEAQAQAERQRMAAERLGMRDAAFSAAATITNPEQRAAVNKLASSGNGDAALRLANQFRDEERQAKQDKLNEELRRAQLGESRARRAEAEQNNMLLREQRRERIQNETAKNFDGYTAGKQQEIVREQREKLAKDKDLEPLKRLANAALDVRRIVGADFNSPEAQAKLAELVGGRGLTRNLVDSGNSDIVALRKAVNDLGAALSFSEGGKNLTGTEREIQELRTGIDLGRIGLGSLGKSPQGLAQSLAKIDAMVGDSIDQRVSTYTRNAPPLAAELRDSGNILAPGYYRALSEKVFKAGNANVDTAPPVYYDSGARTGDASKQKAFNAKYSTLSRTQKLEAWADYFEMSGQPAPAPQSLGTPMDAIKRGLR